MSGRFGQSLKMGNLVLNTLGQTGVSPLSPPHEIDPTIEAIGIERLQPCSDQKGANMCWMMPSKARTGYSCVVSLTVYATLLAC